MPGWDYAHLKPPARCQISTLIFGLGGGGYTYPMKNCRRTAKFVSTWGLNQRYCQGLKWLDVKVLQRNAMLWDIPCSKNSNVNSRNFSVYRSCIKTSLKNSNTTKCNQFVLNMILIYLTLIINFKCSLPFSIIHNTTKWKELFSLKGTTFVYVLSSDWWIK
jgi:hypothetical protein